MKSPILALTTVAMLLATSACQLEDSKTAENAPVAPPISSMLIDFSAFPENTNPTSLSLAASASSAVLLQPQAIQNFSHAAVQVAVWSTLLRVGLVIPVAAFIESFRHTPSLRSDNTWVWSYSVRVDGIIHTVELHASALSDAIQWEMYVTKPGNYLDFNWFSGVSAKGGNSGSWLLRESPENPVALLDIQWSRDQNLGIASVKYTNVRPNDPENGAYITYGITAASDYDAFFDIYQKVQDNLVEIEWNRTNHAGRVANPNFFLDPDWHYWNNLLQDI